MLKAIYIYIYIYRGENVLGRRERIEKEKE